MEAVKEKKKELIKRYDVDGSPFVIIKVEGKYFGSMGNFRITEPAKSKKEIEEVLRDMSWNRIVQIMLILIESTKDLKV